MGAIYKNGIPYGGGDEPYDDTALRNEIATKLSITDLVIKGASKDNVSVAVGARVNSEITIVSDSENYEIAGFKRIFIENATTNGSNRDSIALQSMSTGGGGKKANIAVRNDGSSAAVIKINVECLCIKKTGA